MSYYANAIKKYVTFTGRARRKEYWFFQLFNFIFALVATILDGVLGTTYAPLSFGFIYSLYCLFIILPNLSITVRRLHDTGRCWGFILLPLIPLVGSIWLLVLLCLDSNPEANKYGDNPKNADVIVETPSVNPPA